MKYDKTATMIYEGGQNAELLKAVAEIVEKDVFIHKSCEGSAADVVKIGDKTTILYPRLTNDREDQAVGPWEMAYSITNNGRVDWVFVGHKLLGPCYQRGTDGRWRNCFSHGNFGKNFASGGTWSGAGAKTSHETLDECCKNREKDARSLSGEYYKNACLPIEPPKLAIRRFAINNYHNNTVTVENERLKITLPKNDYLIWGRAQLFSRVMEAMGNQSEVEELKKRGVKDDELDMRYRKNKAELPESWDIKIVGEMPDQIGLCLYKNGPKRDSKGRFCK